MWIVNFFAMFFVFVTFRTQGQELEPRSYVNTPVGLNFLVMGYGLTEGSVATDPSLPLQDAQLQVHSMFFAYARSLDVLGKSAKFDVVVPYAWLSGDAKAFGQTRERRVDGFADPRFRFSLNLFGAPAYPLDEFKHYRQDLVIGTVLEVTAPGGQYDADKLVNIGTNRWSIKPEIGIAKSFGPLTLELAGGVRFFSENDEFFGGQLREQEPIYSVQGHLVYSFGYGIWAAVDGTFYTGGQTTVDGSKSNDRLENSRMGATLALPVNRYNSVKIYYSTGVSTRIGSDFDVAGIAWQYRFGGGF